MVIVSFTTLPSRVSGIRPMVDSILSQTVRPDVFVLQCPEVSRRTGEAYVLPDWLLALEAEGKLKVRRGVRDDGPATKLLPELEAGGKPDDALVCVDDDVVYHERLLEDLLAGLDKFKGSSVGMMGTQPKGEFVHAEFVTAQGLAGCDVEVLGGYRGVAHRRSSFASVQVAQLVADLNRESPFLEDDTMWSRYLKRRGVSRTVVRTSEVRNGGKGSIYEVGNFKLLDYGGKGIWYGAGRENPRSHYERLNAAFRDRGWG